MLNPSRAIGMDFFIYFAAWKMAVSKIGINQKQNLLSVVAKTSSMSFSNFDT